MEKHPLLVGVYKKDLEKVSEKATRQEIKQAALEVIFQNITDSPKEAHYSDTLTDAQGNRYSGIVTPLNKWKKLLSGAEFRTHISSSNYASFRLEGTPNETIGSYMHKDFFSEKRVIHQISIQSSAPDGTFGSYVGNAEDFWRRITENLYTKVKRRALVETCENFGF